MILRIVEQIHHKITILDRTRYFSTAALCKPNRKLNSTQVTKPGKMVDVSQSSQPERVRPTNMKYLTTRKITAVLADFS